MSNQQALQTLSVVFAQPELASKDKQFVMKVLEQQQLSKLDLDLAMKKSGSLNLESFMYHIILYPSKVESSVTILS
jgi:hypothetical protein